MPLTGCDRYAVCSQQLTGQFFCLGQSGKIVTSGRTSANLSEVHSARYFAARIARVAPDDTRSAPANGGGPHA